MKLDMHCHTKEGSSDGKVSIEDYINSLKEQGFDGMVVTDHDSYGGYRYYEANLKEKITDFVVIKGIEYDTLEAGHFVVIMPTGVELKILEHKGLPLSTLIHIVHSFGGILGPAHPCGEPFLSIYSTGLYKKNQSITKHFDFIEGYNCGEDDETNVKAQEIAKKFDKPVTGGSDSHKIDCVGLAYTIIDEDVHNENELIEYIKAKKPSECGGTQYMGTIKEHLGPFNKILVYGFFPYNKAGALRHRRKRKAELDNIIWELKNHHIERLDRIEMLEERLRHRYEELVEGVENIINNDKYKSMKLHRHHGAVSTLEHSEYVATVAERLSRVLRIKNIDREALMRGSLLHDFYLYDWHHEDNGEHKWHGYHHADKAIENATDEFNLNKKERDIIHSHMWPLNITRVPRSREAWLVCLSDKYVSVRETLFHRQ